MKIVTAGVNELEKTAELFDMYRQFYEQESDIGKAREFIFQRMTKNESVIFLAEAEDGAAMGFVQLYPSFTSVGMRRMWILNDLFVHAAHRRKGVAEALLERCRQLGTDTEAAGLILETRNSNAPARKLYIKFGFAYDTEHAYYFLGTHKEWQQD